MLDYEMLEQAGRIADALDRDPARMKLMAQYHRAIVDALNNTGDERGEQDAIAVFEAMAHTLAQQVGGTDERTRRAVLRYVVARAEMLAELYRSAGNVAEHRDAVDKGNH